MKHIVRLATAAMLLCGTAVAAAAQNLPAYMAPIAGKTAATPSEMATKDVLALNTGMFELYGNAANIFQQNILSKHPVILGLFSGAGGRLILYRPGQAPVDAPQVPIVYQLLKSVGHSTMALAQVVGPYLDNAADKSWRGSMLAYRSRMQSALDGLDATAMPDDWRDNNRTILQNNIAFMDDCLAKGAIPFGALEAFGKKQAPFLALNVAWAAQTQVNHWMDVLADWKAHARRRLGEDLRGEQHDLRGAAEQRDVQRAGAVLRPRGDQRPADPDRDDLVHHHAAGHAAVADPHHRGPLGRRRCSSATIT